MNLEDKIKIEMDKPRRNEHEKKNYKDLMDGIMSSHHNVYILLMLQRDIDNEKNREDNINKYRSHLEKQNQIYEDNLKKMKDFISVIEKSEDIKINAKDRHYDVKKIFWEY